MLKISHIKKSFKNKKVLKDVHFEVQKNTLFGFVGVNGAGKSTLIKSIFGFVTPDQGEIFFKDEILTQKNLSKDQLGYLPEIFHPPQDLKSGEFLNYCYQLVKKSCLSQEKIKEVLKIVGLKDVINLSMRSLSKGMRQRIGIAQALIHDPDLIILDEPFSGLDPIGRYELKQLLLSIRDNGKTVFFSSHNLNEIQDLCTDAAILHDGAIVTKGSVKEIVDSHEAKDFEQAFLKAIKFNDRGELK